MDYRKKLKPCFLGNTLSLRDFELMSSGQKSDFFQNYIYQSNYLEGIEDIWWQTVNHGEKPKPWPATLSSHQRALDYMIDSSLIGKELTSKEIRELHGKLMQGLLPQNETGHYRKVPVNIVNTKLWDENGKTWQKRKLVRRCPKPEHVSYLMKQYEKSVRNLENNPDVSQEELLENHAYFEGIHPFVDGNGRVGRLMLNWLSLKHRKEFFIIESANKPQYHKYLQSLEGKFNSMHPRIANQIKP